MAEEYTPELWEEENENDSSILDGTSNDENADSISNASFTDSNSGGNDSDSLESAPLTLSAAPLTAAASNNVHYVTSLEDYSSSETPIPGTLRYILNNDAAAGDVIFFHENLYLQYGRILTLELKRYLPTLLYNCTLWGGSGQNHRRVVFKPAPNTTNVRFLQTLGTSSSANCIVYYCDFTGFDYDGESSTVRGSIFSYYDGTVTCHNCGFFDNPDWGNCGLFVLLNRTGTQPTVNIYNSVFYNNRSSSTRTGIADICGASSNATVFLQGCTLAGYNWIPNVYVTTANNYLVNNSLVRYWRIGSQVLQNNYEDKVKNYAANKLQLRAGTEEATRNTISRLCYDYNYSYVGGPIGGYGEIYVPSGSYLNKVFGDDDDFILEALTALNIPFLSKTEADTYFGEIPE